ncbi:MAG: hypothetical protein ACKOC2_02490, partial [Gemmatimonadota bacterium]
MASELPRATPIGSPSNRSDSSNRPCAAAIGRRITRHPSGCTRQVNPATSDAPSIAATASPIPRRRRAEARG